MWHVRQATPALTAVQTVSASTVAAELGTFAVKSLQAVLAQNQLAVTDFYFTMYHIIISKQIFEM